MTQSNGPLWGLPNDWAAARLDSIARVIISNVDKKSADGERPVRLCNYTDVYYNDYIIRDLQFMPATATDREIKQFRLTPGDVIITKDSEDRHDIAVPALVAEMIDNLVCGYHLAILRPNPSKVHGAFLAALFHLHHYRHYFSTLANGVTRFGLTTTSVSHAQVPLPPLPEQRKIAEILSTWDRTIELTEKLIAAKQRRKKALMQRLLTGKVRFPGFTEPWREVRLDSVSEVMFSNVDKLVHENETEVRLCNYMDVYYNDYITDDLELMQATASEGEIERFTLLPNDVIITKDSEVRDDIAVSAVVSKRLRNVVCGYHLAIIRPDPQALNGFFLSALLKTHNIQHYFSTLANGVTRFGLPQYAVKHATIKVPSYGEQKRIAAIIEAADREIKALLALKTQQQEQKKGLMQQLLTGKVRVKVEEETAH